MIYYKENDEGTIINVLEVPEYIDVGPGWYISSVMPIVGGKFVNGVCVPPEEFVPATQIRKNTYAKSRSMNYPTLAAQLEMLWEGMDASPHLRIEPFYSVILAVKDAFPKDPIDSNAEGRVL